jgi:hypothetical protein
MIPLRGHGMEIFCVILSLLNPPNGATFPPVVAFSQQKVIQMNLDNFTKIELSSENRPMLLQTVQRQNDLITILNEQL